MSDATISLIVLGAATVLFVAHRFPTEVIPAPNAFSLAEAALRPFTRRLSFV